jgi:hypothetical protein
MSDAEKGVAVPLTSRPTGADPSAVQDHTASKNAQPGRDDPPQYDSLYGKIKATGKESSSVLNFVRRLTALILGTVGCTICIAFSIAIPISMIAIGAVYKNDCRAERFIPIYLIVAGVFAMMGIISDLIKRALLKDDYNQMKSDGTVNKDKRTWLDCIVHLFIFAWFIAGSVWIYRTYGHFNSENPDADNYCHPVLYYFAFWVTTVTYIMVALGCLCCCLTCLCGACRASICGDSE